jgi:predicted amidohydrolase YtcJ
LVAPVVPALAAEKADRIFINGKIWTGEEATPFAEALAVRESKLIAVGKTADIQKLKEKPTDVVDLRGRCVYPGFNDAHVHIMEGGLRLDAVDLVGASSAGEVQRRLLAYARRHGDRQWITGGGWAYGDFPQGPNRRDIDAVVADRPVFLRDRDGHSAWVNSVALVKAEITKATRDPEHGVIVRDEGGDATGLLKESATVLVGKLIPPPDPEARYRALRTALDLMASYGLTSVQDAYFHEQDLPAFDRVLKEGGLKVRVYAALPLVKSPDSDLLARYRNLRDAYRSSRLRFGAVKAFVDGVVDARTAFMFEPFVGGGNGIANWTPEDLGRMVTLYDRERFQILLHAVGDRAIRMALDAYEQAARVNGSADRRPRVEHAEVPAPADRARFKSLGVIASTQALFANPDPTTLQNFAVLLGPERTAQADAFKLYDDAGVTQAFGSDWPVFSCEVLRGIYCAVTRATPEGTPAGGYEPQNRIGVAAALRHFTRDAAYASFEETVKGTLAPGKTADFVVLSDDILAAPPERILKAKVLLTVMGGQDTYRAREF